MSVAGVCSMDNLKKSELQLVQQLKAAVAPQVQVGGAAGQQMSTYAWISALHRCSPIPSKCMRF